MNACEPISLTFPVKLKKIVDSPETDHLIYWDKDGLSFHIVDENQLARDVIPNYFKHNNIASFIRQLNMYGFHKINRIESGLAVIGNTKDDSQWSHPFFLRDKPDLLQNITRKVTNPPFINSLISKKFNSNEMELIAYDSVKSDITLLAKAIRHLKQRDEETSEKIKALQEENHQIYSVLMYLREEHDKQSKIIDILIKFISLYANKSQDNRLKSKRVFAIEMGNNKQSSITNLNEPPKKYFVTSPNSNCPQVTVSNDISESFKGKKIIKITPKSILNNNRICGISNINTPHHSKSSPQLLSISLPKTHNNSIVSSLSTSNSKPTFIIQQTNKSINNNNSIDNFSKRPIIKTVTVSSIDSNSENIDKAKNINNPSREFSLITSNRSIGANSTPGISYLNVDNNFGTKYNDINSLSENVKKFLSEQKTIYPETEVSNIISDISANVFSVGKNLKNITKSLTKDSCGSSNVSSLSNISDINSELDLSEFGHLNDDENDKNEFEDIKLLWSNLNNNSLEDDLLSDPYQIQGNELIPFHSNIKKEEDMEQFHDNLSIDDLLQTPDIHSGEQPLSYNLFDDATL